MVAPRRVFFQHMQKTGGTTIVALLENFFDARHCCELGRLSGRRGQKYRDASRAMFVHDNSDVLHLRSPGSYAFTFVRDPFARLLSARRQWTNASEEEVANLDAPSRAAIIGMRALPLDTMLGEIFRYPRTVPLFWNHQVLSLGLFELARYMFPMPNLNALDRYFAGITAYEHWLTANRGNILETALRNLRSLDFVGLYEAFDQSVCELFDRLGLPIPEMVPRLNARTPHDDEAIEGLRAKADPLIELEEALYAEARELNARQARDARGAPADYIRRTLGIADDRIFTAHDAPGGHGWHAPSLRPDVAASRWTGPAARSYFGVALMAGRYRVTASILGAVLEKAVLDLALFTDGSALESLLYRNGDGRWLLTGELLVRKDGPVQICLAVGETQGGYGIEVEHVRLIGENALGYGVWDAASAGWTRVLRPGSGVAATRSITAAEDLSFSLREPPGGVGWHEPGLREDGRFSRWTGPANRSEFAIDMAAGGYRIELTICGAAEATCLRECALGVDGELLPTRISSGPEGRFLASATYCCDEDGPRMVVIAVPAFSGAFGLEIEAVRVAGLAGSSPGSETPPSHAAA